MTDHDGDAAYTRNDPALGGRLPLLARSDMDADQSALADTLDGDWTQEGRESGFALRTDDGSFIGPFNVFLRVPSVAKAMLDWGSAQGRSGLLEPATRQVAMLAVGAVWGAGYQVYAHANGALAVGVTRDQVDAVLARRSPEGLSAQAEAARVLVDRLLTAHQLTDAEYRDAVDVLGVDGTIAVVNLLGEYVTVSALLNTFAVPVPADAGPYSPEGPGEP